MLEIAGGIILGVLGLFAIVILAALAMNFLDWLEDFRDGVTGFFAGLMKREPSRAKPAPRPAPSVQAHWDRT